MMGIEKKSVVVLVLALFLFLPMVSAGVGIKWDRESSLVPERTKTCLTYQVYNPWDDDSYAQIRLSDELKEIIHSSESETKFVEKQTPSSEALPIEFCFKTPRVYTKDCLVGDKFLCEQTCSEPLKLYEGEVEVIEISEEEAKISGGSGGSATQMSVSAPLRVRVQCVPHGRRYSIVYGLVALVAAILLWINLSRHRARARSSGSRKSKK